MKTIAMAITMAMAGAGMGMGKSCDCIIKERVSMNNNLKTEGRKSTLEITEQYFNECTAMSRKLRGAEPSELLRGHGRETEMIGRSMELERERLKAGLAERRMEAAELIISAELPECMKALMVLRYIEGLEWREVAQRMDMSIRWVYQTRAKAIRLMAEQLFPDGTVHGRRRGRGKAFRCITGTQKNFT